MNSRSLSLRRPLFWRTLFGLSSLLYVSSGGAATEVVQAKFNNPGLVVDLAVGLWANPFPVDVDKDGRLDLVVAGPGKPYNGVYYFRNSGVVDPQSGLPLFEPSQRLGDAVKNIQLSTVEGKPVFLSPGAAYPDFNDSAFAEPVKLPMKHNFHALANPDQQKGKVRVRANLWRYVDYNGNGECDLIVGIGDWTDYGWDKAFNAEGEWTNGPLHGYVYLIENRGTTESPDYAEPVKLKAAGVEIDVYGKPSPNFADFDGDGDLDLLCGEFRDGFTYFENIGSRHEPVYAAGRRLENAGQPLHVDLCMVTPVACDFDGDGFIDLVVGDEDGRVALFRHSGKVIDGMPQFREPRYFRQIADNLKFGALCSPVSVDWDGDGRDDLVSGDSSGHIGFIKNLGDENGAPRWAAPVYLAVGGEPIRIMAGPGGSIQGPAETKWGYANISVGDWDGDGLLDILDLGIWGHVTLYRNIGTRTSPQLAAGENLEVAWNGENLKPEWNWWDPVGNDLVTQWRSTPLMVDYNEDGLMDLVTLDRDGYLAWFERRENAASKLELAPPQRIFWGLGVSEFGNDGKPAKEELHGDGPLRLNASSAGASGRRTFCFVDWDGDGIRDLMVNSRPNVNWLKGEGQNEAGKWTFRDMGPLSEEILAGHSTTPTVVEWDHDGVPDILLGAEDGHFYHFRNPRS